jgi:putative component of toxin-antitoxin plasmid stabilization module
MTGPTPSFIELEDFSADWAALKLSDAHLAALQGQLAADPTVGDLVPGGDRLRKVRFAPPGSGRGKRGGVRVYYADLPGVGIVVLAAAYAKSKVDDIGQAKLSQLATAVGVVHRIFGTGVG